MKYQYDWRHRRVKREMATYIKKRKQSFLFSDIPAIKKSSADKLR